jgi:hypothetical protein
MSSRALPPPIRLRMAVRGAERPARGIVAWGLVCGLGLTAAARAGGTTPPTTPAGRRCSGVLAIHCPQGTNAGHDSQQACACSIAAGSLPAARSYRRQRVLQAASGSGGASRSSRSAGERVDQGTVAAMDCSLGTAGSVTAAAPLGRASSVFGVSQRHQHGAPCTGALRAGALRLSGRAAHGAGHLPRGWLIFVGQRVSGFTGEISLL